MWYSIVVLGGELFLNWKIPLICEYYGYNLWLVFINQKSLAKQVGAQDSLFEFFTS